MQHKARQFGLPQFVKNWDMFGAHVPTFNIRGRSVVKTSFGACASILILVLTLLFALLKLQYLVEKKNPTISTNTSILDGSERFNTGSESFAMAFAFEKLGSEYRIDNNYIRWMVRFFENIDGVYS